jgi:hypothetical protein
MDQDHRLRMQGIIPMTNIKKEVEKEKEGETHFALELGRVDEFT